MSFFLRPILQKLFSVREKKDTEMVKPFLDHLEDLRWMLVKMAGTLGLFMVGSFFFRFNLMHAVMLPLHAINDPSALTLRNLHPADSVNTSISLAFYAGIVLSLPFHLYFLAGFVLPALSQKEKSYLFPAIAFSTALFLMGAYFCFGFVLPSTLKWLWYDAKHMGFDPTWTVSDYVSFATQFVLIFGLSFELPVLVFLLVQIGLLNVATLRKTRLYAYAGIFVLAAFVAPSPDPMTMMVVAGPMIVLYEGSILLARWLDHRQQRNLMRPTRDEP